MLGSAVDGRPGLVVVEGEAGAGKTWFVQRLLGLPEARGVARTVVRATPAGAVVLAGPAQPAPAQDGSLPGPLCELRELLDLRPTGLLVVEDVHRAGPADRAELRGLLEYPPDGLCIVLTYRPEELAEPGLVLGAALELPAELATLRIALRPLDHREVRQLALEAIGESCSTEFTTRLHQRSGGVAQVVVDLLADLAPGSEADCERLTARQVDEVVLPVRPAELILGRTCALATAHRPIAWAAAVLDEPAGAAALAEVAGMPGAAGHLALLAALRTAALHQLGQDRYGFRVPMAATAVYRTVPGPARQALHSRAAALLERREQVPWAQLARHRFAGGRNYDWVEGVARSVEEAAGTGAHESVVTLLEEALAEPGLPNSARQRLAPTLARSAVLGLSSEQTAVLLRRVVDEGALPGAARGEIRLGLGLLLLNHLDRGVEAYRELIRAAEELESDPALAARALAALGAVDVPGIPVAEGLDWLAKAAARAEESGDAAARTAVTANRISLLTSVGDSAAWRLLEGLPQSSDDPHCLHHCARALCNAAGGAFWLGEYGRSADLLAQALEPAVRSGSRRVEKLVRWSAVLLDWATGRWDGLAARARALVAEAENMPSVVNEAHLVLGVVALAKGDWVQVGTSLTRPDRPGGDVPQAAAAAGARIRLALARGDVPAAAERAGAVWAALRTKAVWAWAAGPAPWAVEATVCAGRPDAAREMVEELAAGIASRTAPLADAALTWCRGLLAEADGDLARAAECYREARVGHLALPRPYEAALLAERIARVTLAADRSSPDGLDELRLAEGELEKLGASWDLARVRTAMRGHPSVDRQPLGRPSYGDRLSPREREVAALAAGGLTNREIATTLYLSPRTVEQHVARAMRKLRVVSRADLSVGDGPGAE
ncbi:MULTISPECIES: helix-turn-helix transcriptional regulator [unclassified Kitasatospora]|uniref:helix-turn-helix transcriptional regulator n=1 Tax=unclassified Kitasatospora TaxID=2633591 RepID=UPI002476F417|nr:LuxR C-terminal-related transcriptional regulator [Kitasatospora sp. MAP12-44]